MSVMRAAVVITTLVVIATWPFVLTLPTHVSDFGDPLLNSWALTWVARALVTAPSAVFDANIFFPEATTLTYSEPMLVPALLVGPILWAGGDPILAHNVLVLIGYAGSGVTMFLLVRSLTGHGGAALVAGVMFALYPYRAEAFAKVQMQMTMFWPLALWCLHRMARSPATGLPWRWATGCGLALAAQAYSGVYVFAYGLVTMAIVAAVLIVRVERERRGRVVAGAAVAVLVAGVLVLPLARAFVQSSARVGERTLDSTRPYSAEMRDFRRAHPELRVWGDEGAPGPSERRLFPGYVTLTVGAAGAVLGGPAGLAYAAAGIVDVLLARGANTNAFEWLFNHVGPMRAFRVPARFGLLLGLSLSILSGLAVARLLKGRAPAVTAAVVAVIVAGVTVEGWMRPPIVTSPGESRPAVYEWLAGQMRGAVCEYPIGQIHGRPGPQDPTYMYYSTRHWMPLVNGYSGFTPASYEALVGELQAFPAPSAILALRHRQVRYLLVHERYYLRGSFDEDVARLRDTPGLRWVQTFTWQDGTRSDAFVLM